ncbi:MAG: hypothetical protein R3B81_14225 [bacterium]
MYRISHLMTAGLVLVLAIALNTATTPNWPFEPPVTDPAWPDDTVNPPPPVTDPIWPEDPVDPVDPCTEPWFRDVASVCRPVPEPTPCPPIPPIPDVAVVARGIETCCHIGPCTPSCRSWVEEKENPMKYPVVFDNVSSPNDHWPWECSTCGYPAQGRRIPGPCFPIPWWCERCGNFNEGVSRRFFDWGDLSKSIEPDQNAPGSPGLRSAREERMIPPPTAA